MRIVVVSAAPFPATRGSQLLVERTTLGLLERGHDVEVLAPSFGEEGRTSSAPLRRAGLPRLGRVPDSHPDVLRGIDDGLLLAAASRIEADVFVGHNLEGGLIAGLAARWRGAPAVYVRHTAFADELALVARWGSIARPFVERAERAAERLATRRVELAPHACGPAWDVIPPPADPFETRIEPGPGNVLYYEGNLDAYQNPGWLDAALEAARAKDPSVRLVHGRGPNDRPDFADLALAPRSLPGGFPMKLLAYQVAGIPAVCVSSGAPGMVDRTDAFVVPGTGSAEAFAARVVDALADPKGRSQVRERARTRALKRHDPTRVAKMYEEVILDALSAS